MTANRTTKLATFLALVAASPSCNVFAFTPSSRQNVVNVQQPRRVQVVSASKADDIDVVTDGWRKVSCSAAAFLTGLGIMAQVAFADPTALAASDERKFESIICAFCKIALHPYCR